MGCKKNDSGWIFRDLTPRPHFPDRVQHQTLFWGNRVPNLVHFEESVSENMIKNMRIHFPEGFCIGKVMKHQEASRENWNISWKGRKAAGGGP